MASQLSQDIEVTSINEGFGETNDPSTLSLKTGTGPRLELYLLAVIDSMFEEWRKQFQDRQYRVLTWYSQDPSNDEKSRDTARQLKMRMYHHSKRFGEAVQMMKQIEELIENCLNYPRNSSSAEGGLYDEDKEALRKRLGELLGEEQMASYMGRTVKSEGEKVQSSEGDEEGTQEINTEAF